jgi:CDP-diacylglycerol---glycerol-3-phosphate 3-phosphatidyltransferase
MSATWITLSRFPLLLASMLALYHGSPAVQLAGIGVLLVGLLLDTVDGIVARRTGQTSLFGSVLDIAADRTYELVLWVGFADLGLIPAWVPFVILTRTTLTDAFRSLGVGQGAGPFDQHRTALGRFVVRSSTMRIAYSAGKVATFCGLGLVRALDGFPAGSMAARVALPLTAMAEVALWITVLLCLVRGVPVIVGGLRRHATAFIRSG